MVQMTVVILLLSYEGGCCFVIEVHLQRLSGYYPVPSSELVVHHISLVSGIEVLDIG